MEIPKKKDSKQIIRKSYEKPAIVHGEIIDAIAASCIAMDPANGKTGIQDNCQSINS